MCLFADFIQYLDFLFSKNIFYPAKNETEN